MVKLDFIFSYFAKKKNLSACFFIIFCSLMVSCHEGPGAICRDGHRSYSTGRGTCSWHGGIDHWVDGKEISIPRTAGLIAFIGFVGLAVFEGSKNKTKNK